MANRTFHPVQATEHGMVWISGTFTTNSTSAPTVVSGMVSSVARDGVGQFSVTLKNAYNQLYGFAIEVMGTAGTKVRMEAEAIQSADVTLQLWDEGATAAVVDTTGEVVYIALLVRQSALTSR